MRGQRSGGPGERALDRSVEPEQFRVSDDITLVRWRTVVGEQIALGSPARYLDRRQVRDQLERLAGCGPIAARSPSTHHESTPRAEASATTASAACRFPCMSERSAIRTDHSLPDLRATRLRDESGRSFETPAYRGPSLKGSLMPTLHIEHAITDRDTWLGAFARFAEARKNAGVVSQRVRQPVDDANYIFIDLEFETMPAAEAFKTFLETVIWQSTDLSPGLGGVPIARVLEDLDAAS